MLLFKLSALLALALLSCAASFPVYLAANGTVTLTSAAGGDLELAPDAGGALGFSRR